MTKQTWTAAVAALLFVALAALIAMVPVPFVTWTPGSTHDLLGEADGTPLISITGADTFAGDGQLLMSTVSVTRPDSSLTLPEALFSHWLPSREVLPREAVYKPGAATDEIKDTETRLMDDSQTRAIVAALRAAGVRVIELPMVTTVAASGPANDKLMPGDLITAVDDIPTTTTDEVRDAIAKHSIGDVVKFTVLRDRMQLTRSVSTRASATDPDAPVVGIGLATGYTFTPRVTFSIEDIGGSSAGLPFALAIYELLTPDSVLGGRTVAATGTIAADGQLTGIGGVEEKIAAAARDGATVFVLPAASCVNVVGAHEGIRLVAVDDLGEALTGLAALNDPATEASVRGCS